MMPILDTSRIIIHFDYDCFYASVIEAKNPSLKGKPLAIQQKQIIVTCNYEARNRGLRKLQLIKEARKICPDVIIVLGEDLTPFRDASKELYNFIRSFSWNSKIERLGLDEVFLDVTDVIEYNKQLLGADHSQGFFHIDRKDPSKGWLFDATTLAGYAYPKIPEESITDADRELRLGLYLASHLAQHVRLELETIKGYTSTVGVATNKLLSKLVGNVNKPRSQTTLLPPYVIQDGHTLEASSNVSTFLDQHEVGKLPGIGFKTAYKLREFALSRPPTYEGWNLDKGDSILVSDLKAVPGLSSVILERVLAGPGAPNGIGQFVWNTLHGIDNSPVALAQDVPKQISIEDSYGKLETIATVSGELVKLSKSLISRLRTDLLDVSQTKWMARPKTLRLSTRPSRATMNTDDQSTFHHARVSRSISVPTFIFSATESVDLLATRLVNDHLLPLFRKLHPGPEEDWALSLLNIAVTNMEGGLKEGRDIQGMFQNQEAVLREWKVTDDEIPDKNYEAYETVAADMPSQQSQLTEGWIEDEENVESGFDDSSICSQCGIRMPSFAMVAHERFHSSDGPMEV